jgi:serine/threonine protein kinase
LLDGGRAPDGTPYLVMEYIDGEPIDAYCDRRRLAPEERIALVRTVCAAVHYAHQNLIVHRDLKPNNILITPQGVPKLLDFGIAKLLDTRQSAATLAVTHAEYRVMTPAHASPEQVRGDVITTASDIYVLGVLLYELLCGRRPFQLLGASLLEMERIICEQEAPSPSEMVSLTARASPELLNDVVACRSTTPARLQKFLRGEVDSIIGMAMRKDPERRYSSAEQLAADLDRHLGGKPVLASKDTWLYRTRKFVGRHKRSLRSRLSRRSASHTSATSPPPSARVRNRFRRSWSSCSSSPIRRAAAARRSPRASCSTLARDASASDSRTSPRRAQHCSARSARCTRVSVSMRTQCRCWKKD